MSSRQSRIRVLIADDHPLYREGLARAIKERPELDLIGEAPDGRQALGDVLRLRPDVAVLDVRMPELEGPQVLNAITRDALGTQVLFLSANLDGELAYALIAGGAKGFLSKRAERREICEAITRIARGETVLSPEIQSGLAVAITHRERQAGGPRLTPRELEVLRMIAEGQSAPQIGREIHLSTATVKGHLQNLYEKLGVSDRAAAVAEAMRRGLLE